jgi:hypothetical protein
MEASKATFRHPGAAAGGAWGPSPKISIAGAVSSGDGLWIAFGVRGDGINLKRKGNPAHPGESRDPDLAWLARVFAARLRARWFPAFAGMSAGDELRRKIIALSLSVISIICAGCETSARQESAASSSVTDARPSLCLAPSNFQGCCSWNLGMKYFEAARLICKNDNPSPTCSKPKTADLRGCCSGYGDIKNIELSGIVNCKRGTSPNCRLEICSL